MSASSASEYSDIEERANAITHGLGVVLGVVGLILLLIRAFDYQADMLTVASMAVYGSSIILLFLASTLYHSITTEKTKRLLKTLDHCAIYLLIAGSYTPFLLVGLRTPLAMGLMAVIWGIALVGIIMKIAFVYRFKRLSLFIYLAMGWLSLIVVYQLAMNIDIGGLVLLAVGGVIY
ncbi:PAQR family membrane homeostasis protein TrhA, partial [Vibrio splendidus]